MTIKALLDNPVAWGILVAVVLIALLLIVRVRRRRAAALPYMRRPEVLPAPRRSLLQALRSAVGEQAIVLVQVPLQQVLAPRRHLGKTRQRKANARLEARHIDFLLCTPEETRPLVAVLVDHGRDKSSEPFEEAACVAAGLGLLRLNPEQRHSPEALHDALRHWLETPTSEADTDPLLDGRREPILDLPRDPD